MAKKFKKDLAKVINITARQWKKLGDIAAVTQKREIRDNKFFKSITYTPEYRAKKIAGKAGLKGVSVSSRSGVVDLTLSGKFLNSLRARSASKKGVIVGPGGAFEKQAEGLASGKNPRSITDDKLVDKMTDKVIDGLEKMINRNIDRTKETIKIEVKI